ncbi:MAG TPA: GNAT family protein [Ktedonobacterales bacterium]
MFRYDLGDGAELRILQRYHAPELLAYVSANRTYLGRWLGWAEDMRTLDDAETFIARGLTRLAEDDLPWVGIWQDGHLVGGLLFFPVVRQVKSTEIGYWLSEAATGKGLMTRAARAMLGYAFEKLGLNKVGLQAEVENTPSRAVADRLGFTFEGVHRDAWTNGARLIDLAEYSLLAREWQARRAEEG